MYNNFVRVDIIDKVMEICYYWEKRMKYRGNDGVTDMWQNWWLRFFEFDMNSCHKVR
jgi:hypothetical protein